MSKPVIGLTGGIACGKSTVAQLLAAKGAAVLDADRLARDVVAKGTPGLAQVVEAFGPEILADDGTLDRAALGALVFADPERRKQLEAITHPLIALLGMQKIAELQAGDAPYIVYEAALLVETGRHASFPALIVVAVAPEVQLDRLVHRDHLSREQAEARIASQLPIERKTELATWVIRNEGELSALESEVERVHHAVLDRFGLAGEPR